MNWWQLFRSHEQLEQQLDAELRFDYEQRVAGKIALGMGESEARRAVRLEFGGIDRVKEECRDARGFQFLHALMQDVRYALRGMGRFPGFTALAVIILALGIGINITVFTIMNAVLLRGFPMMKRSDRVVYINEKGSTLGCCVSLPDFYDWQTQATSFSSLAIIRGKQIALTERNGSTQRYNSFLVSANTFQLVGQAPILGRDFTHSDESYGAPPVAILSYGFWEQHYGEDPSVIGRTVRIDGNPATVIGIMPRNFAFPMHFDLWMPFIPKPAIRNRETLADATTCASEGCMAFVAVGRLKDGVTIEHARTELETIGRRLANEYPATNRGVVPSVFTFSEYFIGPNSTLIYGCMWGAVAFVLLIACANLANLALARTIGRSRELSVRVALGAGRTRIVRQLLTESVMLSIAGGIIGWWIAAASIRIYAVATASRYQVVGYAMDSRVTAYSIAIAMGTGLLFGLAPVGRFSKLNLNDTLKDGARGATGGILGKRLSGALVMAEMTLAVVLLAGAGVMVRSFLKMYTADVGVQKENVLLGDLRLPENTYASEQVRIEFFEHLKTRMEAIPGVESATIASHEPGDGSMALPFEWEGTATVEAASRPTISALIIGENYFRTMGATVFSGREFNDTDGSSGSSVAVVNRQFVKEYLSGSDPLGRRIRLFRTGKSGPWMTVVGVVSNILQNDPTRQKIDPLVYVPFRQEPPYAMKILARTHVPPASLEEVFRREIQGLDSDVYIQNVSTLAKSLEFASDRMDPAHEDIGKNAVVFPIFAVIGLLLATVGLYSVTAYLVNQRTSEIGIRMAIGATGSKILILVVRQSMLPAVIGLTAGLAASVAVNRLLGSMLVGIQPSDPFTLIVASTTLMLAVLLGCLIPARRASRIDPMKALRQE